MLIFDLSSDLRSIVDFITVYHFFDRKSIYFLYKNLT